jgi:hypothetical protein
MNYQEAPVRTLMTGRFQRFDSMVYRTIVQKIELRDELKYPVGVDHWIELHRLGDLEFEGIYYVCLQHPSFVGADGFGEIIRIKFDVHNKTIGEVEDLLYTKLLMVLG